MPLEEYRKKRKFDETPEPTGRARPVKSKAPIFVVQKHDATNLHYDFRLEINGALVSWAVPRGPSFDPSEKRLAIRTEDHPLEYAEFEGVIPKGHYGAGRVMVWDQGSYDLADKIAAGDQLALGELKVVLHGTKLRGEFVLIHSGARGPSPLETRRWLLIKHRDEHADPSWDVEGAGLDRSVLTGRTLQEIADGGPVKRNTGRSGAA